MQGNLGLSDVCLNKIGEGPLGIQCYIPNFKHLSKVVLKMKFLNIFTRTPMAGPSWILRPWFEQSW